MKEREYIAYTDDGHDFGEFLFNSEHRANSKANKEDARKEAIRKYGYRRTMQLRITKTELNTWGVIL